MAIAPDEYLRLADLIHRFWAVVDEQTDTLGPDLFTEAGELVIGAFRAAGRDELTRYFSARRELSQSSGRATRHLSTNLRLLSCGPQIARLHSTITVFSGYGLRPIPLGAPSSLADFTFDCHLDGGEWRLTRVEGQLVFTGADTPDLNRAQASTRAKDTA